MEKSSTSKGQRIAIWIIIVAMAVGSVGAYFVIILQNDNAKIDQEQTAKLQKEAEEQAKMPKEPLEGYTAAPFDAAAVTELKIEEIVPGTGKEASESSTVSANYFGWTSDGVIFDSSNKGGTATPVEFPLNGVIKGWTAGLKGAKEGSVRKLTIPADQAYGVQAPTGYPSGPLMFVVELKKVK
jgi:FKBP-type peptidyl-prolyl cis-trans isomerase